ncbi:Gag-pro-like protein [Cucumis melo var. makuwa]|uniref:Gag-pro-like protein n=1 Tax=Cucumis melo var. makuwa TaxID=1194695 RepID=A0A5D3DZH7_CUCMM|nr:Gag-pro-like protein [Cucumis melo var. makuwa]
MFINTLQAPHYDRMVGSASTNFSDVITIGERIEFGVKNGRITDSSSETRRMMTPKKKEEEIHELSSTQRVVHVFSPNVGQTNYSPSYQNEVGNSTENCFPLEAKVQSLVKAKWLKFKKTGEEPDVNQNPLPNNEGPTINVVDTFKERYKNEVCDVTTSMNALFQILHGAGYLSPRFNNDEGRSLDVPTRSSVYSTLR